MGQRIDELKIGRRAKSATIASQKTGLAAIKPSQNFSFTYLCHQFLEALSNNLYPLSFVRFPRVRTSRLSPLSLTSGTSIWPSSRSCRAELTLLFPSVRRHPVPACLSPRSSYGSLSPSPSSLQSSPLSSLPLASVCRNKRTTNEPTEKTGPTRRRRDRCLREQKCLDVIGMDVRHNFGIHLRR